MEHKNKYANELNKHFGRCSNLPLEVLKLELCMFRINTKDLSRLAFEIAEKNKLPHQFNKDVGMAGKKWYYQFMKPHPCLSLRLPEPTSMARATGFCREKIEIFFNKPLELDDNHNITADLLYNVDETGISTVQKPMKVLALKGKHQVGGIKSGERGVNTTGVCCINAVRSFVPPMLIFKRKRFKNEIKDGAPPLTIFGFSVSGWITTDLFTLWIRHFISYLCLKLLTENPEQKKNTSYP